MSVLTTPHLNFRGDARAALEHYRAAFGGDLVIVTNADAHAVEDPAEAHQVKWGQVANDAGFRVMAYDVPASLPHDRGVDASFVSVRGDSAEEISAHWEKLAVGSTVLRDLGPSPFSPVYGMLRDPFGIVWVLDVAVAYDAS